MTQEPFEEWIDETVAWLAEHVHDALELERALRQGLWRGAWHFSAYQGPRGLEGLSLVTAAGRWLLEGLTEPAVYHLGTMAGTGKRPSQLNTSAQTKARIRPLLAAAGLLCREEDLLAMVCRRPSALAEGRWAKASDLPVVEACARRAGAERDWRSLIAAGRVALLARKAGHAAIVTVESEATFYAVLGEVRATGEAERRELGERVVGFAARELLAGKPAVQHLVAEADAASIALFRKAGFEPAGHAYHAWLA